MPRVEPDPDLPDRLADIVLPSGDGGEVRLGDCWAGEQAVLIHLRHFGWLHCRHHVAQLRDAADELTASASVLLVGTGSVRHAQEFAAQQQLPFPLVVDPRLLSYRAVGAGKETPFGAVKPSVVAASVVATAQGARQGRIGRHPLVLGATHVMRPGGTVAFAWRNADFADNAPVEDILAVVEGADRA